MDHVIQTYVIRNIQDIRMSSISLSTEQQSKLFEAAKEAHQCAYAPYSKYRVGAALLTDDGQIFVGCNVENAAFPATICAERAAVASAVSQGHRNFVAVAVVTKDGATPCGICRQVLGEFSLDMIVYSYQTDGTLVQESPMSELLPSAFKFPDHPASD